MSGLLQPEDIHAGQVSTAKLPSLTEIKAFRGKCGTSNCNKSIGLLFKK